MVIIDCPHCGKRNQSEFRYGGEYNARPKDPMATDDKAWSEYVYIRDNKAGVQREWWYHRTGCGTWFLADRNTKTNVFDRTWLWEPG